MKEPWDYENVKERIAEADHVKERGTMFFKVRCVCVCVCVCVCLCVYRPAYSGLYGCTCGWFL